MKRIKFTTAVILLMVFYTGCGKNSGEVFEANVISATTCWDMATNNATEKSGFYKDEVYYVRETQSDIFVKFVDQNGEKTKEIVIPVGAGPGEMRFMVSMRICDDKIYAYDGALKKIAIYDLNGDSIDELNVNEDIGMFGTLDIMDGYLYYHGLFKNKLVKIDLNDGSVVKVLQYDEPQIDMQKISGKPMLRGTIKADPETGHIYIGYYNEPFRIEKYDADLNLVETLTRKLDEDYEPQVWTNRGTPEGNFAISTLNIDSRYLIACFGGGFHMKGTKIQVIDKKMRMSVFDKISGDFLGDIFIDAIPVVQGVVGVAGMDNEKIILNVTDMGKTLKDVDVKNQGEVNKMLSEFKIKIALVYLENPLSYE